MDAITSEVLEAIGASVLDELPWEVVASLTIEINGATGGVDVTAVGFETYEGLEEQRVTVQLDSLGQRLAAHAS